MSRLFQVVTVLRIFHPFYFPIERERVGGGPPPLPRASGAL